MQTRELGLDIHVDTDDVDEAIDALHDAADGLEQFQSSMERLETLTIDVSAFESTDD